MNAEVLTAEDVAEMLRTSPDRVRRLANEGKLTYRQDGRFMRFTPADVQQYLEDIKIEADHLGSRSRHRR